MFPVPFLNSHFPSTAVSFLILNLFFSGKKKQSWEEQKKLQWKVSKSTKRRPCCRSCYSSRTWISSITNVAERRRREMLRCRFEFVHLPKQGEILETQMVKLCKEAKKNWKSKREWKFWVQMMVITYPTGSCTRRAIPSNMCHMLHICRIPNLHLSFFHHWNCSNFFTSAPKRSRTQWKVKTEIV